ncbi:MAG TPA: 23S rRNA (pseudouridine(1915)-N(3))-methyltransferase RlmH [Hyphomicrobiales bacterium]|nr:23S rRNA (pseudouridine(1915)-N(3))-methyltransferase RlmH [Rhodobiaceae bacterium]HXK53806.1 23S rRNA (pseudouridine(1915)-N(3))-methyltransferase RlmH [Hyphomicrobiales bacterium]
MKIVIAAIGKMRPGAEKDLTERYCQRAAQLARGIGFSGPETLEYDEARARQAAGRRNQEAAKLLGVGAAAGHRIAFDEGGKALTTRQFAGKLGAWRDQGAASCALLIGGPDGHGKEVLERADLVLALGAMTWPHMLARAMIAEQVYRAMTVLAGHPYHRD